MAEKKLRRSTRQRRVVLEELRETRWHPTAAELYDAARRRLPRISLGTVYRNLEVLAQMGIVRKLETGGAEARFDGHVGRHHHVRCVGCGRVDDADDVPADPATAEITTLAGYRILDYRLDFIGVCPACQRSARRANAALPPASDEHE